ncbi:hypothetical protein NUW58_g3254 [Xylaria curta]|uniref:Uncharacterized protein n=1 Tax=Xylaria curta TaxID=42375 RepID=A0ACC1PCD0_9PEZI|nr:hypothetical protein NUW58_g3254 [Xylaria curta]
MASLTEVMEHIKHVLEYLFTPSTPVIAVGLRRTRACPSSCSRDPAGGGKTSLLTLLERGDAAAETHTSQTAHAIELTVSSDAGASTFREAARDDAPGTHKKFHLVDTPGHGKLRGAAMAQLAGDGKSSKTEFGDSAAASQA